MDHFHELLLVDCRFLLVVFFEKISKLVLLLIKFVVQFLVLCQLRLDGFVLLSVGFCELKSMVSRLFVKFLNLENLRSREAEILKIFFIFLHVFQFGQIKYTQFFFDLGV